MLTVLDAIILLVRSPSSLSVAVAPGSTKGCPTSMVAGLAPRRVMVGGVFVTHPDVQTNGETVRTRVDVAGPQLFVALSVMLKTPAVVGIPLIVFVVVANESPGARVDVATEKMTSCVDEAVRLYEKDVPTVPEAVSELVI